MRGGDSGDGLHGLDRHWCAEVHAAGDGGKPEAEEYSLRIEAILPFEAGLHQFLKSEHADILSAIASTGKLEKASEEALGAAIKSFKDRFVKDNADAVAA